MPRVTKDQIAQAKTVDLLTYLRMYEPNNLIHLGGENYTTKDHDSLKISNGKWHWFSRSIGGKTALKYLIDVKGMEFIDAVLKLCSEPVQGLEPTPKQHKKFILPKPYINNNRVIDYLKRRGIYENFIHYCIQNKLIYESKNYHNAVFVGYEKDIPRYAALRGTWQTSKAFKGEVSGSDKRYSFCIMPKEYSEKLIITESAIDALSVATLRNAIDCYYLSLAGVYAPEKEDTRAKSPKALKTFLKNNSQIKHITLCLDNDKTGRIAARFIAHRLAEKGYIVIDKPPQVFKDYNEYVASLRMQREQQGLIRRR